MTAEPVRDGDSQTTLFATDLDNTLLGDEEALVEFSEWLAPRRDRIRLAYVSGRFYESLLESLDQSALPTPDALIGGVGTNIRLMPGGEELAGWPGALGGHFDAAAIRAALHEWHELDYQPAEFQSHHKVSYYFHNASADDLARIRDAIQGAGQDAQIVYSSARDLDILPAGVTKGTAAAYLAQHWGIAAESVIVCGDSGNDLGLFEAGFRGVVVANAHPELLRLEGPRVYCAKRPFAAGALDGLRHWIDGD